MLKTSLIALAMIFYAHSGFASEKPVINPDVDPDVRTILESALEANKAAKAIDAEWIWAVPINDMWSGSLQDNSKILDQAISLANEGKLEQAKKLAVFIEQCAKEGMEQAQKAKKAGPAQYGL